MKEVVRFLKENNFKDFKCDETLSEHTTFKVGGLAAIVVVPESKKKIIDLIMFLHKNKYKFKVIGNGSNILPSDKYYNGVIIKTNKALKYLKVKNNFITVGSGYSLIKLAYDMLPLELEGLEFLGGIPGTIGGAVYMNAGAYNKEMKDVVVEVKLIDRNGNLVCYSNQDLKYSYRKSILQKTKPLLIIETKLKLNKGHKDEILYLLQHRKQRRLTSQPLDYPSGGSTFRNPKGKYAYLLIDKAGLRGFSIGGAKVSDKHCNFIINYNNATSEDIKSLIDYVKNKVYEETKVKLKDEIEYFNW